MISNYSLFKRSDTNVAIISLPSKYTHGRKGGEDIGLSGFGLRIILEELECNYDYVSPNKINQYDYALLSVPSVVVMAEIMQSFCGIDKGKCIIIAGGMGMLNIWPIYDIIDIAVFGRAEGQINAIMDGEDFPNVWRKSKDPQVRGQYIVRQANLLLPGESGVGCRNNCAYCQYTHIRKWIRQDNSYRAGSNDNDGVYEDDWFHLELRSGRNQTALDGLTQDTRLRVSKPILNKHIIEKLSRHREACLPKTTNIKVFEIIGYPWENEASVSAGLDELRDVLALSDGPGGRIFIMLMFTPFSPEPYTPLVGSRLTEIEWRPVLLGYNRGDGRPGNLYNGQSIEAMILPQIQGLKTLRKRFALNFADENNRYQVSRFLYSGDGFGDIVFNQQDYRYLSVGK